MARHACESRVASYGTLSLKYCNFVGLLTWAMQLTAQTSGLFMVHATHETTLLDHTLTRMTARFYVILESCRRSTAIDTLHRLPSF